jgi:hypothetical protein
MKKSAMLLVVIVAMLFVCGNAFAVLDSIKNNSPEQDQTQGQLQGQGQAQGQGQGQLQGQAQAAIAAQGQGQGQIANGKVDTDVSISGDADSDRMPDAIGFPSVIAAEGTSSGSASYGFGSLGKANTETYKKVIPQIQTVLAIPDNILPQEEKVVIVKQLVGKMTDSNRTQRFLGIMWEDNSKSLLNMFGLLCWDSVWAEGQKPFQSKSDMK